MDDSPDSAASGRAICWVAVAGLILALLLLVINVPHQFLGTGGAHTQPMLFWGTIFGVAGGLAAVGLGLAGWVQTAGHRCRGRWGRLVAILAIPLGLLAAFVQFSAGARQFARVKAWERAATAITVLATTPDDARLQANADHFYRDFASVRFRTRVSSQAFRQWVTEVLTKHGQLQSKPTGSRRHAADKGLTFRFNCVFVTGAAEVKIRIGFADGTPRVDDIAVAGLSPGD